MDRSEDSQSSDSDEEVYFSSVIDEEDIDRIKRNSEIDMESSLIPPLMGQTYNQLILTYVIGIVVQSVVYFSVPFILGIEEPFLSEPGGEGLQMRRRIGTVSSVAVGVYFIISVVRGRGSPALSYIYIVFSPLILWMLHIPFIGSEPVFSLESGRSLGKVISVVVYFALPYFILFKLFKYGVELWIRLDDDNLRRAIEWEKKHLHYGYCSDREMGKKEDEEDR